MNRLPRLLLVSSLVLALGACGTSDGADAASSDTPAPVRKAPRKAPPTAEKPAPAPAPSSSTGFIEGLPEGAVIRATCEMGVCDWLKVVKVERSGVDAEPKYNFDFQRGESKHPADYPASADGVAIQWLGERPKGVVKCSRKDPYASVGGQGDDLKLSPAGVPGAMQTAANTYFAACHGESGNDGELAAKFGYDLR